MTTNTNTTNSQIIDATFTQAPVDATPDAILVLGKDVLKKYVPKAPITSAAGKINLTPVSEMIDIIPELKVIQGLTIDGTITNPDGSTTTVQYPVDRDYKMTGHLVGGTFRAVPWMKSQGYTATSHVKTLEVVSENLTKQKLEHGIWKNKFSRNYGYMTSDILLNKTYKINEDLFEDKLSVSYNNLPATSAEKGTYQPMVRLSNSFYGASKLEFMIVRIMCLNGMMRIAGKQTLGFVHMGQNVIGEFERRTDAFLTNIFEKKALENIMLNMADQPMVLEKFIGWLLEVAGPRAVDKVLEQFLPEANGAEILNRWIAYNMITWLTTHVITDRLKQNRLMNSWEAQQKLITA